MLPGGQQAGEGGEWWWLTGRLLGMHRSGRTSSTSREALNARWCSRVSAAACVGSIVVCTSEAGGGVPGGFASRPRPSLSVSLQVGGPTVRNKHDEAVMFAVLHDWSIGLLSGC